MAPEQPLAPGYSGDHKIRVRRGLVQSVDLYEIKDSELEALERGSPADLQLNFAIFLLSIAFAGGCTIMAATFSDPRVELLFMVVTVCGTLIGAYLMIAWWRNRKSLKDTCNRIRERIPVEASRIVVSETEISIGSQPPKKS